jgi:hypothetical protein
MVNTTEHIQLTKIIFTYICWALQTLDLTMTVLIHIIYGNYIYSTFVLTIVGDGAYQLNYIYSRVDQLKVA